MTEPRGNEPMDPEDDLAALAGLDLALDQLAAGHEVPDGQVGGEAAALATLAAELRAAVPAQPPGAAERGRAAFLATARRGGGRWAAPVPVRGGRGRAWRRALPLRLAAMAAALVVLVALPAAARQARPGTALWPFREVGQQVRDRLADDPVHRAHLRLNTAASYIAAGAGAGEERRKDMADQAEERIEAAFDALDDVVGPRAAAERARAQGLLLEAEALERQEGPDDRSGSGSGSGDDRSGSGGGDDRSGGDDDPAGDGRSGRGGGSGSGPGGGSAGSGSGSRRSGSGDD
jgi:hypothetical protein